MRSAKFALVHVPGQEFPGEPCLFRNPRLPVKCGIRSPPRLLSSAGLAEFISLSILALLPNASRSLHDSQTATATALLERTPFDEPSPAAIPLARSV